MYKPLKFHSSHLETNLSPASKAMAWALRWALRTVVSEMLYEPSNSPLPVLVGQGKGLRGRASPVMTNFEMYHTYTDIYIHTYIYIYIYVDRQTDR